MISGAVTALQRRRRSADELRAARASRVTEMIEQFVHDLGLLIAGCTPDLSSYLEPDEVARLNDTVRPAVVGDGLLQPDFGEYAQVRIEGDILDDETPLRVEVEFEDRSVRYDAQHRPLTHYRRQVRITAVVDTAASRIVRHRIAFV